MHSQSWTAILVCPNKKNRRSYKMNCIQILQNFIKLHLVTNLYKKPAVLKNCFVPSFLHPTWLQNSPKNVLSASRLGKYAGSMNICLTESHSVFVSALPITAATTCLYAKKNLFATASTPCIP